MPSIWVMCLHFSPMDVPCVKDHAWWQMTVCLPACGGCCSLSMASGWGPEAARVLSRGPVSAGAPGVRGSHMPPVYYPAGTQTFRSASVHVCRTITQSVGRYARNKSIAGYQAPQPERGKKQVRGLIPWLWYSANFKHLSRTDATTPQHSSDFAMYENIQKHIVQTEPIIWCMAGTDKGELWCLFFLRFPWKAPCERWCRQSECARHARECAREGSWVCAWVNMWAGIRAWVRETNETGSPTAIGPWKAHGHPVYLDLNGRPRLGSAPRKFLHLWVKSDPLSSAPGYQLWTSPPTPQTPQYLPGLWGSVGALQLHRDAVISPVWAAGMEGGRVCGGFGPKRGVLRSPPSLLVTAARQDVRTYISDSYGLKKTRGGRALRPPPSPPPGPSRETYGGMLI